MDERRLRGYVWTVRAALALLTAGAGAPHRSADASAIHSEALSFTTEADLGPRWPAFLAGGPALWAVTTPPDFPSHLVLLYQANGVPVETPFVDYLIWRRNLDPVRFDLNHPGTGPTLDLIKPPTTTGPAPQDFTPPPNVPEPGGLTVALTMTAVALGWHCRTRLRHGRRQLLG